MLKVKSQKFILYLPLLIWVFYLGAWVYLHYASNVDSLKEDYTDTYSLIALTAAVSGLVASRKWGLFKSKFGASIGYVAVGLFLQFMGHLVYALYYRVGNVELAFPSVGDIPFLLTGIMYILALHSLLKVIVFKGSIFKPLYVFVISAIATLGVAWFGYSSFLHVGIHDERGAIYSLLNVAYPLIQIFYFLLGIVALLQAKRMSGGKMLTSVSVLLVALIIQYAADFSFLYQSYHETWAAAGSNDLAYVIAYGLMALAVVMIDRVRQQVSVSAVPEPVVQPQVEV